MKILTGRKIVLGYKKKKPVSLSASVSYICTALYLEHLGSYKLDTDGILWLEIFPGFMTGIQYSFSSLHSFYYLIYHKVKGRTKFRFFGKAWITGEMEIEVYEDPT